MPDRAGRPTAGDWMRIGNSFAAAAQGAEEFEERRKNRQDRAQIESYLNAMGRGEKIDPKAADYSYVNHLAASAIVGRNALQDENLKRVRRENDLKEAEANQKKINTSLKKARTAYFKSQQAKSENQRAALKRQAYEALLPIYAHVPDGGKFVRWKDETQRVMIFADMQGNEIERETPPLEQAMAMAVNFSNDYANTYLETRDKVRAANMQQMISAATDPNRRMRTASGKEAIYFPSLDIDENGDTVLREQWLDPRSGKVLKGFDTATGKEVKSNLHFRPMAYWRDVAKLSDKERKGWDKAVAAASKAWVHGVKEGTIDASITDRHEWELDYSKAYFKRLRPGAPLPAGLEDSEMDHWRNYVPTMGDGELAPAHTPGQYDVSPAPASAGDNRGLMPSAEAAETPEAQPAAPAIRETLPKDVSQWDVQVVPQNGRNVPYIMIDGQAVELTADEYLYWMEHAQGGRSPGLSVKGVAKKIYGAIPKGKQPLVDRSGIFNR